MRTARRLGRGRLRFLEEFGTWLAPIFAANYVLLAVPTAFFLAGALGKKLMRHGESRNFFAISDLCLAPEACLANIATGLTLCLDLLSKFDAAAHRGVIRATLICVGISVVISLVVIALHNHFDRPERGTGQRIGWLVVVSNLLALIMMWAFVILATGV